VCGMSLFFLPNHKVRQGELLGQCGRKHGFPNNQLALWGGGTLSIRMIRDWRGANRSGRLSSAKVRG
jgi:hypothetical protein